MLNKPIKNKPSGGLAPSLDANRINWPLLLLAIILALGIVFRFGNLDRQIYWHDETYTSLRMSGYSAIEVNDEVFNGSVVSPDDLKRYQYPNDQRGIADTVRSLAIDDSQHPPIYYVAVRQWVALFGESIWVTRSLSALISLLIFPAVYWLCQELFAAEPKPLAKLTGGIAIALIAVSPYFILYAQEAREYSLWTVDVLVSSALLLRALRLQRPLPWLLYAIAVIFSFYTHPFTGLTIIGHGVYVLVRERFRVFSRNSISYLLCLAAGVLAFAPWLSILLSSWSRTGATWTAIPIPLIDLLKSWGLHLTRAFVLTYGDFGFDHWSVYLTLPFLLALLLYALYVLCRTTPLNTWWFVLTLIGSTVLPLALPDLILGGQRSTSSRYLVPFYLGLELAIAYLFARLTTHVSMQKRALWRAIAAIVLSISVISSVINMQADTAWSKVINYNIPAITRIVNQSPQPLIISRSGDIAYGTVFSLSYHVKPETRFLLVDGWDTPDYENVPTIPDGFSDIFLLNVTDPFRAALEQQENAESELAFNDYHLWFWKLTPKS